MLHQTQVLTFIIMYECVHDCVQHKTLAFHLYIDKTIQSPAEALSRTLSTIIIFC
jgi:hypothetical protein